MRLGALEGMVHTFFDELRQEGVRMPNGREFPRLFDFTREGALSLALGFIGTPLIAGCLTDIRPSMLMLMLMLTPTNQPIELSIRPDLNRQLVPGWTVPELLSRGIDLNNFTPIPLEQMRITLD